MALIVQKYGGTSMGSVERIEHVAAKVAATREQGPHTRRREQRRGPHRTEAGALPERRGPHDRATVARVGRGEVADDGGHAA